MMAEPARGEPDSPATPQRGAFGVFEDVTNTPSPLDRPGPALGEAAAGPPGGLAPGRRQQQRRRLQMQAAPMVPNYAEQPEYAAEGAPQQLGARPAATPPGACVALRRYSLKSRRAAPYAMPCSPKSVESARRFAPVPQVSLQTVGPPRAVAAQVQVRRDASLECSLRCSRDPGLAEGRRRICCLNTEDHVEYQRLEDMGGRFAAETHSSCGTSVSRRASMQTVQASFIQEGSSEGVVGYVAMRPGGPGGNGAAAESAPTLVELYVEPNFRHRGLATAALKVLLSGYTRVAVGPPAPEVAGAVLKGLGFKAQGSLLAPRDGSRRDEEDEEHAQRVLFKRRVLPSRLQKENELF